MLISRPAPGGEAELPSAWPTCRRRGVERGSRRHGGGAARRGAGATFGAAAIGAAACGAANVASSRPDAARFRQPVRSGQVIYAQRGDLIVLAPVNAGATYRRRQHPRLRPLARPRARRRARACRTRASSANRSKPSWSRSPASTCSPRTSPRRTAPPRASTSKTAASASSRCRAALYRIAHEHQSQKSGRTQAPVPSGRARRGRLKRRANRSSTRPRIVPSAPYDAVSLEEIAAAASVTVQSVLRIFGSKEALFEAAAERAVQQVNAERDAALAKDLAHPPARFRDLVRHLRAVGRRHASRRRAGRSRAVDPRRRRTGPRLSPAMGALAVSQAAGRGSARATPCRAGDAPGVRSSRRLRAQGLGARAAQRALYDAAMALVR